MNKGLNIFTSNRLEILAEQLARVVREPLTSPLSPEIIIVQSRGMQHWLAMEVAKHNRISANCSYPFPNTFLNEMFNATVQDLPEINLFEPGVMAFRIMKILPEAIEGAGFSTLKAYLKDDNSGLKLFQLSEKIADTFDQYLVFRPEMIFAWESGKAHHWQAHIWRMLVAGNEKDHRARLRETLLEAIRNPSVLRGNVPERISIFGISHLPSFHMQVFSELSHLSAVHLFLMNPCQEYWADILSNREKKRIKKSYAPDENGKTDLHLEGGNRLLVSMGQLGKEFFSQIIEMDCEVSENFLDPGCDTLLTCIQSDILQLKERETPLTSEPDPSIQIHSCHSPMREIEVLHDNLLAFFEADPEILPKDIIVMAPDIEVYAPYIQAVFDAQTDASRRIPFSLADRSAKKEYRVLSAFQALLDLRDSKLGPARVLELLEFSTIREKFNLKLSEIGRIEGWIRATNIRWGVDAENRARSGIPAFPENTWRAGIERLLLGFAMPGYGDKMFAGILPYDHIEGGDGLILGRFVEFFEGIISFIKESYKPKTLDSWSILLDNLLEKYFSADESSEHEIQILRRLFSDMRAKQEVSGFRTEIEYEVIREYLEKALDREPFGHGFISGGLTFCTMLPMRSIPFKVVALIGMNTDAFPRDHRPLGFDLMAKNPKPGDRSRRKDDKYLFLEALISARKGLYISYIGQSIRDNSLIPPSVLVSELVDYMKTAFGFEEDQIVTRHRLQAFSPAYFQKEDPLFSYSEENLAAAVAMRDAAHAPRTPRPFFSGPLPMTTEESEKWRQVSIDDLCSFFSHPARFLLQRRLGIFLGEETPLGEERENFKIGPLERFMIRQDLLEQGLSGTDLADFMPVQKALGRLPHGTVGEVCYNQLSIDAEDFIRRNQGHTAGSLLEPLEVDFELKGFQITGRLDSIYAHGLTRLIYADFKTKYELSAWVYHLILNFVNAENYPRTSLLICRDTVRTFNPVESCEEILKGLLNLYRKGLEYPLYFYPETSRVYALQFLEKHKSESDAVRMAKKKWVGSDFNYGESQDPYNQLCFGKIDPDALMGGAFMETAEKIFTPLWNFQV